MAKTKSANYNMMTRPAAEGHREYSSHLLAPSRPSAY